MLTKIRHWCGQIDLNIITLVNIVKYNGSKEFYYSIYEPSSNFNAALAAGLMVDHNHKTLLSEESLFVKCGWMLHIWVWWWT